MTPAQTDAADRTGTRKRLSKVDGQWVKTLLDGLADGRASGQGGRRTGCEGVIEWIEQGRVTAYYFVSETGTVH